MHTPTSPVHFEWAQAMNAADSSWRVWMKRTSLLPAPGAKKTVDAIARKAVDLADAPLMESLEDVVGDCCGHSHAFFLTN